MRPGVSHERVVAYIHAILAADDIDSRNSSWLGAECVTSQADSRIFNASGAFERSIMLRSVFIFVSQVCHHRQERVIVFKRSNRTSSHMAARISALSAEVLAAGAFELIMLLSIRSGNCFLD